jgi:hypothetical protein
MYKINHDSVTGQPYSIQKGDMSIPICEANADFQDFLKWNVTGKLDYKTPIKVTPPAPVETLEETLTKIKADIVILKAGKQDKI